MEKLEFVEFIVEQADFFAIEHKLTDRETELFRIMMRSPTKDQQAIAAEMVIYPGTVSSHTNNIFRKTKTRSREELTIKFLHYATTERPLPPMNVLAIDDNPIFLDSIGDAVESVFQTRQNFRTVSGADSIEELFTELRTGGPLPELVLLDLYMPRISGYDVLRTMRADPTMASMRIIVFSSTAKLEDVTQVKVLGATHFVSKTEDVKKLRELLRKVFYYWSQIAPAKQTG